MNNKTFADICYIGIAIVILPLTYKKAFEHKSHQDFRQPTSLT